MMQPIVKFHDGYNMPQLGLGVWKVNNQEVIITIETALKAGYRSIDTASIYKNEEGVGKALQNTAIPREDLFITTKLWNSDQTIAQKAIEGSLIKLGIDYVNLYLIHWPVPIKNNYLRAWKDMIKIKEQGLTKSIGVCNFEPHHLQRLIDETGVIPVINQVELHPLLQQKKLRAFNSKYNIITESWSPLAKGSEKLLNQPTIKKLANKYNKTPVQIIIRWHLDNKLVVIPKSATPTRIYSNFDVFNFSLTKYDLNSINKLDSGIRLGSNPNVMNTV